MPAVVMCIVTFGQAKQLVVRPDFDSTQRGEVYAALTAGQRVIPRGSNTIMYNGARDRVDLYYYLMYYQLSSRGNYVVDMHYPERIEQLEFLENYDYIIIAVNDGYIYQKLGEYNIEKKGRLLRLQDRKKRKSCNGYRAGGVNIFSGKLLSENVFFSLKQLSIVTKILHFFDGVA
ncbi:MAG: hypothetical protein L6V89_01995 [Oscillospiraceae bacterium]|nr:MAG: hypothetical protein L6V89_01995 [Oscillospiraceae bacterium]